MKTRQAKKLLINCRNKKTRFPDNAIKAIGRWIRNEFNSRLILGARKNAIPRSVIEVWLKNQGVR